MRSRLAATASVALLVLAAAPALAADYPVLRGTQIEDTPPPPMFEGRSNFEGFYFGGLAGGSQSRVETEKGLADLVTYSFLGTSIASSIDPNLTVTRPRRDSGSVFGGFAGYNMQFGDAVVGLEADYMRVDQTSRASTLESRRIGDEYVSIATTQNLDLRDQASLRLRFGYAYGKLMPYFTIGAAVGRFDTNVSATTEWGTVDAAGRRTGIYNGWPRTVGGPRKDVWGYGGVVGGGLEAALTDNILVRGEYLYTRFNDVDGLTVSQNTARVGAAVKF